jgi:16S rRNA (cytosine967-C5)-methyltransferase
VTPAGPAHASVAPAREAAFAVLLRAERDPGRLGLVLGARPELAGLASRDRALASELVSGTLKRRNALDAVLGASTGGRRLSHVDVAVRAALRLGAFQLLYLDRVPAHAAVNDSVELAKRRSRRAGGFVNAVLRRVAAEGPGRLTDLTQGTSTAAVALRTAHPEWLVGLWRDELGEQGALELLEADNKPAPRVVRVNSWSCTLAEAIAALSADGIAATQVEGFPHALTLAGPPLEASSAFRRGFVTPQSLGSQLAAQVALDGLTESGRRGDAERSAELGEIADLCAAPGAKTSQLADAQLAERVVAVEADERRATSLRANLARQGHEGVQVVVADVEELGPRFDGRFAAVLLDPPCTGLGTLASRPDLRWRHRPSDLGRLAGLQRRLLARAAGLVAPGGTLTYSVCTITNAETLGVIDPFLKGGGWSLDDLSAAYPRFAHPKRGGLLLTLPSRHRTSGFFIARLRRESEAHGKAGRTEVRVAADDRLPDVRGKEPGGHGENT